MKKNIFAILGVGVLGAVWYFNKNKAAVKTEANTTDTQTKTTNTDPLSVIKDVLKPSQVPEVIMPQIPIPAVQPKQYPIADFPPINITPTPTVQTTTSDTLQLIKDVVSPAERSIETFWSKYSEANGAESGYTQTAVYANPVNVKTNKIVQAESFNGKILLPAATNIEVIGEGIAIDGSSHVAVFEIVYNKINYIVAQNSVVLSASPTRLKPPVVAPAPLPAKVVDNSLIVPALPPVILPAPAPVVVKPVINPTPTPTVQPTPAPVVKPTTKPIISVETDTWKLAGVRQSL